MKGGGRRLKDERKGKNKNSFKIPWHVFVNYTSLPHTYASKFKVIDGAITYGVLDVFRYYLKLLFIL